MKDKTLQGVCSLGIGIFTKSMVDNKAMTASQLGFRHSFHFFPNYKHSIRFTKNKHITTMDTTSYIVSCHEL